MYSNVTGNDGTRLYFDGGSMVCVNGEIVAQAPQFSVDDVETELAIVDLESGRNARMSSGSVGNQSGTVEPFERVTCDI